MSRCMDHVGRLPKMTIMEDVLNRDIGHGGPSDPVKYPPPPRGCSHLPIKDLIFKEHDFTLVHASFYGFIKKKLEGRGEQRSLVNQTRWRVTVVHVLPGNLAPC